MKAFLTPLSTEDEEYYLGRMKNGDLEARNILVERNMRLVAHIAKKYQSDFEEMEDLISIGTVGLMKAVLTFSEEKGNRLATYAARCIENELLMYMRSKKKISKEVSLYEPIGTDQEGNQMRLVDIIDCDEPEFINQVELTEDVEKLYKNFKIVLSEREAQIICYRYGIYHTRTLTQREIAQKFGISRSYVSRIEKKALLKLKGIYQE